MALAGRSSGEVVGLSQYPAGCKGLAERRFHLHVGHPASVRRPRDGRGLISPGGNGAQGGDPGEDERHESPLPLIEIKPDLGQEHQCSRDKKMSLSIDGFRRNAYGMPLPIPVVTGKSRCPGETSTASGLSRINGIVRNTQSVRVTCWQIDNNGESICEVQWQ